MGPCYKLKYDTLFALNNDFFICYTQMYVVCAVVYDGIKKAVGPTVRKMAPLKSTSGEMLTGRDQLMERWVEHYSELYSRETVVTNAALNAIRDLPMMEELDNEPTIEDLSKAIDSLSCGKAPGCDSILPEVIKCAKPALLQHLHQLLCLYVAFIDLTKAFDLVSRKGLFRLLEKIGCPPKLRSMVVSFHENMKGTVVYNGSTSEPFPVCSGVKQGCVLAPTLFGIFFSLLLSYAFDSSSKFGHIIWDCVIDLNMIHYLH